MTENFSFSSNIRVTLDTVHHPEAVKAGWLELEKYRSSVFLSWAWIGSWLASVPGVVTLYALRFYNHKDQLVGIAMLAKADITRRKFFKLRILSLNESPAKDSKFIIEYNNILHIPEYRNDIYQALLDFLAGGSLKVDELELNALDARHVPDLDRLSQERKLRYCTEEASKAYFTDLRPFNKLPENYLATLSRNKREQIRRSIRYYQAFGDQKMEFAENVKEGISFFMELGKLHTAYWATKGRPGSFANRKWVEFHQHLISNHFQHTQLIRLSYGDHLAGYLYNLVDSGAAYSLQSGFNYSTNKHDRPGLVAHYLATNHYISRSFAKYEYLAGESQYKQSLSTDYHPLGWYTIQRKGLRTNVETALLKLVRTMRRYK